MTPHNARCGTGRIQQHAVKQAAIPPPVNLRCIHRAHLGGQLQALQRIVDSFAALRILIQRQHRMVAQLQQVRRLAARRGAGIKQTQRSVLRQRLQQQRCRQLRRHILHRDPALGKTRQLLHRTRALQHDAIRPLTPAVQPGRAQLLLQIGICRHVPRIDTQRHRSRLLTMANQRRRHVRPMVALQSLQPPVRHIQQGRIALRAGLLHGLAQGRLLTQITAQHGIHHGRAVTQLRMALGRFHRLVDQREVGVAPAVLALRASLPGQHQRTVQQGLQQRCRTALHQLATQQPSHAQSAQGLEHQRLHARAQGCRHGLQRRGGTGPGLDLLHHRGHLLQLLPQRRITMGSGGVRRD